MNDYVAKPIDRGLLLDSINRAVAGKRSAR